MSDKRKPICNRPFDFVYDPLFIVATPEDYKKHILRALMKTAEYTVHPIYPSMFSDHHPRSLIIPKRGIGPDPSFLSNLWEEKLRSGTEEFKNVSVGGSDRYRFYQKPNVQYLKPFLVKFSSSSEVEQKRLEDITIHPSKKRMPPRKKLDVVLEESQKAEKVYRRSKGTQTDYRESESQTVPWTPPYVVLGNRTPEVLQLAFISWGKGPPGVVELEIIERHRKRLGWEKWLSSLPENLENLEKRRRVLDALETDEWIFRKKEIETEHEERMSLAQKMLGQLKDGTQQRLNSRLKKAISVLRKEEEKQKIGIQSFKDRELRKLKVKYYHFIRKAPKDFKQLEAEKMKDSISFDPLQDSNAWINFSQMKKVRWDFHDDLTKQKELHIIRAITKNETYRKSKLDVPVQLCKKVTKFNVASLENLQEELKNRFDHSIEKMN